MMEEAIASLVNNSDRFYAEMILQMNRVWDSKNCPTIGVSLKGRPVTLVTNPNFWNNPLYGLADHTFFLKHEVAHLIANHGGRVNGKFTPLDNIAGDIAIHEIVKPSRVRIVDGFGNEGNLQTVDYWRTKIPTLENGRPMEYYREMLQDEALGGEGSMDDHDGIAGEDEITQATVRSMVQRAVDSCRQAGTGTPAELRSFIEDLLSSSVDWRRELRNFPDSAEVAYLEESRRIRNRRYGLKTPGWKKIREVKIAIGFDVSGSIGDEFAGKIAAEIRTIVNAGAEVEVFFFDDGVREVRPWTENFLEGGIPGGGGTLFQPVLDAMRESEADGIIMLTDGCNFDAISDPGVPVLWGILPGFDFKCDFGRVLNLIDN